MDTDNPFATVRLAADGLDPAAVTRLVLGDGWPSVRPIEECRLPSASNRWLVALGASGPLPKFNLDIQSKPGLWMASTDRLESSQAELHLASLLHVTYNAITSIRTVFPSLDVSFSLLSFRNPFALESIYPAMRWIVDLGSFVIELPLEGKEMFFTSDNFEEVAA